LEREPTALFEKYLKLALKLAKMAENLGIPTKMFLGALTRERALAPETRAEYRQSVKKWNLTKNRLPSLFA
jgi:hypothetical protein